VAVVVGSVKPQDTERTTSGLVALGKAASHWRSAATRRKCERRDMAREPRPAAATGATGADRPPAEALGLPAGTGRFVAETRPIS